MAGWQYHLSSQGNHCCVPGRSIVPLGTKTLHMAELKAGCERERTHPTSTPWFWDPGMSALAETEPHNGILFKAQMERCETEPCPSWMLSPNWYQSEICSKSLSLSNQSLPGDGICDKTSESHGPETTLLHFCGSDMNSWVRSNVVGNTMMLNKASVSV